MIRQGIHFVQAGYFLYFQMKSLMLTKVAFIWYSEYQSNLFIQSWCYYRHNNKI